MTTAPDSGDPIAELRRADGAGATASLGGFTTTYTSSGRTWLYHHCTLSPLEERTAYEYRVATTGHRGNWTGWANFTSLYADGVTRVAMYGDMGPPFGAALGRDEPGGFPAPMPIGNLVDDVVAGRVDWVVHAGDHAYEFAVDGGQRGDGYMDAYQPLLERAPWAPGWGNHEFLEEDRGNRLLNITAGMVMELARQPAATPGATAQWYSVKIGLLHLIMLDLDPYMLSFAGCLKVDTCGYTDKWLHANATDAEPGDFIGYRKALLAWLEAELKAVNRRDTPWVMLSSHFPLVSYTTREQNAERDAVEPDLGGWGQGAPAEPMGQYVESDYMATCEGSNYVPVPKDPWGTGTDGSAWCPLLPANWTAARQVAACKQVCDAGRHGCVGFVVYGPNPPLKNQKCCFRADASEKPRCAGHGGHGACASCFVKAGAEVGPSAGQASADLEPLMLAHGVDMYFAGHAHYYETSWPVARGVATQKNYKEIASGVVHVTSGIAGPPEYEQFGAAQDWTNTRLTNATSYSRVTFSRDSLAFEQVGQDDGTVLDSFVMTKKKPSPVGKPTL